MIVDGPTTYYYTLKVNFNVDNKNFSDYTNEHIFNLNKKIEEVKNKIMNNIESLGLQHNYTKLKYIHDYLVTSNVYILDENRRHIRNIYGALVEEVCVCEGYAEAFQYLAQHYNIHCIIARSADHEWNFVKMEDNKWYVVDVT